MAEASSTLETNTSPNVSIINSIQQPIDSNASLISESSKDDQKLHAVNFSNHLDRIDDSPLEQEQHSVQKDDNQLTNFTNSSQIEAIDEKKEVKREKRPRKKGNNRLKMSSIHDFERQTVCDCDKRGSRARVVYFREEMEALRYVKVGEQKKKWIEVHCGLGSDVAKEYDNLGGLKHGEEKSYVNFDPRPRLVNKKGVAAGVLGKEPENVVSEMKNTNQADQLSGINDSDLDGVINGDEDNYEDEDSDSEYVTIQRPAFFVSGEPDFDSGPPQDGLEYLRRVRWETEHIPKVKIAKVEKSVLNKEQTVYMPNIPAIAACPDHLVPSKEWEDVFLADFSNLRLALLRDEIETIENIIQENLDFPHTDDDDDTTITIQENLDFNQTKETTTIYNYPSLQTIINMEPVARAAMLRKRVTLMEPMSSLARTDGAWLFALCAAIDTPLDGDTSASVRCLLRKCATLRAEKTSLDDEVIMLNILVTISGKYFGQLETVFS